MIKLFRSVCIITLLLCGRQIALAQQKLVSDAQQLQLQNLAQQHDADYRANYQSAAAQANAKGWPLKIKRRDGGIAILQGTNSFGFPIYLKTDNNTTSAATTSTNTVQPGGLLGLNLSGSSPALANKLAIWDGGWVLSSHQEFAGKSITIKDANAAVIDHTTHVAGTMVAKGVYAPVKGMAFGATTLASYDFNNDEAEMTAAASTLLLSNHSYGPFAGWNLDDQNRWVWYGLPGDTEDYTFGFYDKRAQSWDKIAYNAPYYLIVESSGNSHDETGPAVGGDYWGYRSRTDATIVDKGPRPAGISNNDSYDVIASTAVAKNILTVGAVNQLPFGPVNRTDVSVASFSSWGPTDDGRVKPDIVGAGVNVLSTSSTSNTSYLTLSGTSMAAPNVTGSLYLLQEYYAQKNSGNFMRSATLKALACHTAFDAGNIGPDYIYGWGLLDMKKAAQAITDNGTKSQIKENMLTLGQTQTFNVIASGNGALSATIAWTDPAGTPLTTTVINDRTPKLVNDLDIRVSDGTTTFMPWVLDPANPSATATTGDNVRDNVEQVFIPGAVPGRAYTITITHKGTLQANGPQPYSLIITGVGGTAYCASAPASSADSRINNITLANLNNTPGAGCTSYSNYTNLTVALEQGKTYPISITAGTCGSNFNKIAKVYIDYNGDGVFDPVTELAATTTVIAATGTYNGTIAIPGSVAPDTYSLMRVVLSETTDASTISPCGTYAKGETQDYRVQFTKTTTDAGVIAVNSSTPGGACAGKTNITVRLKNFGSANITSIPVTVTIQNPDNSVTTLNETYTATLAPSAEDDFILQGTFNTVSGATYKIAATTNLSGDPVTANNTLSANVTTGVPATVTNLRAYYCTDTKKYILTGSSDGGILWYKNATDTAPIAAGNTAYTTQVPVNNTFYAAVNDYSGTVGPATKSVFTGGGYNQFTPSVKVTTSIPVVMQSARLYIGNSGKITFNVANTSGQIVSSTTINAVATRTIPGAGAQTDDPNDQGKVYTLNLLFPTAGDYTITAAYDNTATLYRSNAGVTGYPFNANGVFRITGNNAVSPTSPLDTSYNKTFYYYFYNIQLTSAGCASAGRIAVAVNKPVITQKDSVLSSNFSSGNQWYFEGNPIAGATGQNYVPQQSGNYTLGVNLNTGCMAMSDVYRYALLPLHPDDSDIGLSVFPVPASTKINIQFKAPADDNLILSLVNNAGQTIYTQTQTVSAGAFSAVMDVSKRITGTYILEVTLGGKSYGRKILIVR